MIPKVFKEVIDLGDGREISIETGKLAKQAHGSVVAFRICSRLCPVNSQFSFPFNAALLFASSSRSHAESHPCE